MTKEEIEAEFYKFIEFPSDEKDYVTSFSTLLFSKHIADIAIAKEREECAKVCDNIANSVNNEWNKGLGVANDMCEIATDCADAIRGRI